VSDLLVFRPHIKLAVGSRKSKLLEKLLIQLLEVWNSREKGAFLASFDLLSSST